MITKSVDERVSKGVKWIEDTYPVVRDKVLSDARKLGEAHPEIEVDTVANWPKNWYNKISTGSFDIRLSHRCVLGQLFESFYSPLLSPYIPVDSDAMWWNFMREYGFLALENKYDTNLDDANNLQDTWISLIKERQHWFDEGLI